MVVELSDGIEVSEVVDGQQRLTTLNSYFNDEFTLVSSDEAPYISPNSVYYAEKRFSDLPKQYQSSFKKYRLSIIKLRNLGDMKLEIFRRINQGGTPLSGQDIRLAYYGDTSKSVVFIRLTGVYDKDRASSVRTIKSAKEKHEMSYPWVDDNYRFWNEWWLNKGISYGQRASEMFLWSLLSIYYENLSNLLHNHRTLNIINCRYHNTIDEALDAFCGYLKHQDKDETVPRLFMSYEEMSTGFVSYFMNAFSEIVLNGASLPATKHRLVASTIGNLYKRNKRIEDLSPEKITNIIEFIRKPQIKAQQLDFPTFPSGKGRWAGGGGYYKQFEAVKNIIERIIE